MRYQSSEITQTQREGLCYTNSMFICYTNPIQTHVGHCMVYKITHFPYICIDTCSSLSINIYYNKYKGQRAHCCAASRLFPVSYPILSLKQSLWHSWRANFAYFKQHKSFEHAGLGIRFLMFLGWHFLGSKNSNNCSFLKKELGEKAYGERTFCIFQGPGIISYISYILIVAGGKWYFGEFTF